jgi:hypothetical protein
VTGLPHRVFLRPLRPKFVTQALLALLEGNRSIEYRHRPIRGRCCGSFPHETTVGSDCADLIAPTRTERLCLMARHPTFPLDHRQTVPNGGYS